MKYRTIKFYPHHDVVQFIEVPVVQGPRVEVKMVSSMAATVGEGVFNLFYYTGLVFISPLRALQNLGSRVQDANSITNSGLSRPYYLRHSIALFSLWVVAPIFLLNSLVFGTSRILEVQGKVLGAADSGLQDLQSAQSYLQLQQPENAEKMFSEAVTHFQESRAELSVGTRVAGELANLVPQKRAADNLLQAAAKLSAAGANLTAFYRDSSGFKITAQGLAEAGDPAAALSAMESNLLSARDNVKQANDLLSEVSPDAIPTDRRPAFKEIKRLLAAVPGPFDAAASTFSLLKSLVGGDKKILFVFENNNELRASGGFMGTYGAAQIRNGSVKNIRISSIYDLDGQLKETIIPPYPILRVSDRWFLRDTNWFADFPSSAQKIIQFYEKEGGETPDAVIALTTSLVTDLLKITGPIALPKYGLTLTSDNFVETTQIATSINYDKVANTPKQMLADFFPVFLERLGTAAAQNPADLLLAFERALSGKHLLAYSRNQAEQKQLEDFNWAGQIKTTDRDFLTVSFSNLGGTKTDLSLQKKYQLDSIVANSAITNDLTINVTNPLVDNSSNVNRSFVRVYVPKGASLISITGSDPVPRAATALLPEAKGDTDVSAWEERAQINSQTGNMIGEENGKTVFGFWLETRGGQNKTVSLKYRIPLRLAAVDHFSILWQKQPGSVNEQINYTLKMAGKSALWKNFAPTHEYLDTLTYEDQLEQDYLLGLVVE